MDLDIQYTSPDVGSRGFETQRYVREMRISLAHYAKACKLLHLVMTGEQLGNYT